MPIPLGDKTKTKKRKPLNAQQKRADERDDVLGTDLELTDNDDQPQVKKLKKTLTTPSPAPLCRTGQSIFKFFLEKKLTSSIETYLRPEDLDRRAPLEFPSDTATTDDDTPKPIRKGAKVIDISESESNNSQVDSENDFKTPRALQTFVSDDNNNFIEIDYEDDNEEGTYELDYGSQLNEETEYELDDQPRKGKRKAGKKGGEYELDDQPSDEDDQPKKGKRKVGNKEREYELDDQPSDEDDQPKKSKRKAGNKETVYKLEDQPKESKRKSSKDYELDDQPKKSKCKTGNEYPPADLTKAHKNSKKSGKDKRAFRKEVEARRAVIVKGNHKVR
jgi:hypothetical protein